ncbi:outer membrane beta-barrel protein [uncultured Pontibacter sp.]|uniref:outer membrane beta-barrel protein n=1 Tax=uncultured Pontibacter sp. TaxID=453356 RepID=UPI0026315C57|nr:outer membrane beta-barrel protein [uncultured Pontibacter sp.]
MQRLLFFILAFFAVLQASAQGVTVYGSVRSATDQSALPGASVVLTRVTYDTKSGTATDTAGVFKFGNVQAGMYTLEVSYLGFKPLTKSVQVQEGMVNLGKLELEEAATTIKEVQVVGRVPLGDQKGDTTSFNAGAFKTAPDASAEDLVQKMPGITVVNGTIQAQGQDVKQVLVDGKRFFGDDPSAALRNLPADVIASIEIFDKKSDKAELTGVDDGNEAKTINIVTKPDRRNGVFGKASAGYGTDNRYMIGASLNFFDGDRRITFTGLSNNINMLDFSVGETPGGGMRGRRSPSGGGNTSGLISTNTFGLNYSDMWSDKVEVTGNYKFTDRDIQNDQYRVQQYILAADSGRVYTENNLSSTRTTDHQFNLRLDYDINENNRLLFTPSLTLKQVDTNESISASTVNNNGAINETQNNTASDNISYTLKNNLYFSHKFGTPGRTVAASLNTSISGTDASNALMANTVYYRGNNTNLAQDQQVSLDRNGFTWSGDVTYTEPVGENGQLQAQYTIGNQLNNSDRRTYTLQAEEQQYTYLDTTLSSKYSSDYLTQRFGTGYQYNKNSLRVRVGAAYQVAELESEQQFPEENTLSRTFVNVLPDAQLKYKFSDTRNLDFNYSTSVNAPNVEQLQQVVDTSNPLQLTQGNAALEPSYQHTFRAGLRDFNRETNQMFFVGLFGSISHNYIGSSLVRAEGEPVKLENGLVLEPGQQLSQPVNLDGYWNVRSVFHYGLPVNFLSSNFGLNGSIGYTRTPGLANGELSYVSSPNFSAGLMLSSNISEKVDFTISSNATYNIVKNSLQPALDNNYFNQNTNLKLNLIFWKGLVYRTELNHQAYAGLSEGYDNNYLLWNMSISKKLFKNQQGELSLSVNDLLQQNVSLQRNLAAQYVEDVQSSALQRYFMLTFTYNLRNFSGGQDSQQERKSSRPQN